MPVTFTLNGKATTVDAIPTRTLLWVLRDDLGLTGTKYGCGMAQCGSCTVIVDQKPVRSCVAQMRDVAGKQVTTIEGLAKNGQLHPVQKAFIEHLGFQCGYCTPGMIMGAVGLLAQHPQPTFTDIATGLNGHLCRCAAHPRIVAAIETAATAMKGGAR